VKQIDYFANIEYIEEEVKKTTSYIASKMPDANGDINTSVILDTQDKIMFYTLFRRAWAELLRILSGYRKCHAFRPDREVILTANVVPVKRLTAVPAALYFDQNGNIDGWDPTLTAVPAALYFDQNGNIANN
jgi:hypothetical protein